MGDPDVAADHRAGADDRFPSQDRRIGIDDDVIFDRRVALPVAQTFAFFPAQR